MKRFTLLLVTVLLFNASGAFAKKTKHKTSKESEEATATSKALAEDDEKSTKENVGKAVRIPVRMKDVYQKHTPSRRIRFFVKTDSTDVPIITLGDNAHFPRIANMSARERYVDNMSGVVIDVIFDEEVSPETHKKATLAINLWQPNLTKKEYPLFPSDGKKVIKASEPK